MLCMKTKTNNKKLIVKQNVLKKDSDYFFTGMYITTSGTENNITEFQHNGIFIQ